VVPFIVQFGLYVSPVGFSSSIVPAKWRMLYDLNPMVGVIDGFRWSISGGNTPFPWQSLQLASITIAIVLASGIWYFRKTERTFADII
jgi:lipopolysaccharide transport system permease protein